MTSVICTSGILILSSVVMLLIRDSSRLCVILICAALCIGTFSYIIARVTPTASELISFFRDLTGEKGETYLPIIVKGLGISYLTSFTSDTLESMECDKPAKYAEAIGRAEITLLAIPLVKEILDLCVSLIN